MNKNTKHYPVRPPRLVDRFLEWFLPEHLLEDVQGDLYEVYFKQVKQVGKARANKAYLLAAIQYIRPYFFKRKRNTSYNAKPIYSAMLQNYFITAFRNMQRNPAYSLINILGLTIGVTCCLLIFLLVRFELSYDTYHTNAHHTYRIVTEEIYPEGSTQTTGTPLPMINGIRTDFPQLLEATAIYGMSEIKVTVPAQKNNSSLERFKEERITAFVEPQYFKFFDYKWIAGNPQEALSAPNTMVITQKMAQKYFGSENPIGKKLEFFITDWIGVQVVQITGLIENPPANTDFPFHLFLSYASFDNFKVGDRKDWRSIHGSSQVYVMLPQNYTAAQLEQSLIAFNKKYRTSKGADISKFHVQPLSDIHFNEELDNYNSRTISKQTLLTMSLVGVFLIVTACINFINLATAQAIKRAKEVGIRKVLGSSRAQLLWQFVGETFLITGTAMFLSLGFVWLLLPPINNLLDTKLPIYLLADPIVWMAAGLLLIVVTLLAGFYPAIVLASYQPVRALKSKITAANAGNFTLRRSLVVLQFAISQMLIIGTIVISTQMSYFQNAPLGFNKEAILRVPLAGNKPTQLEALRSDLTSFPGIQQVSYSLYTPSSESNWDTGFKYDNSLENAPFPVFMRIADTAYFSTYGLEMVAGRKYMASDTIREFVVNETFVKKLGIIDPQEVLGKSLSLNHKTGTIVGVVKDFHTHSLHKTVVPSALTTWRDVYFVGNIKLASTHPDNIRQSIAHIEKTWKKTYPEGIFEYEFIDEIIAGFYKKEEQLRKFFQVFAGIAIFIGCLGLYGLVSFMAAQRIKEIGVRKVLGASVAHILWLFSKEFLSLIMVAFLIAAPVAYYFMGQWLENFAYSIPFHPEYYLLALGASILIALLTASYKSVKAAIANPVKSLRNE